MTLKSLQRFENFLESRTSERVAQEIARGLYNLTVRAKLKNLSRTCRMQSLH